MLTHKYQRICLTNDYLNLKKWKVPKTNKKSIILNEKFVKCFHTCMKSFCGKKGIIIDGTNE